MKRTIAIASLAVGAGFATAAWADSHNIKGSYAFTGTAACLAAPGSVGSSTGPALNNPTPGVALPNSGFQPNLRPNDAVPGSSSDAYTHSFSVEGIRTFDGHGHGTVKGTSVGITVRPTPGPGGFPHFPPSASGADFSFNFTYTVSGNTWTATMVPGSYLETFTAGPRTGQTATVDAIPTVTGVISNDGQTLIAAHLAPVPEVRTFSNGDVDPQICHRSRVYISIGDRDDDDHDRDHDH